MCVDCVLALPRITQADPGRRIPPRGGSVTPHSQLVCQELSLPHTTSSLTHIGSWLYCFHGWSLHKPVLRFGYDNKPQASSIAPDKALNCRCHTKIVPNPSPQVLFSTLIGSNNHIIDRVTQLEMMNNATTQTQTRSCEAKQF
jgi:hypothetical protein